LVHQKLHISFEVHQSYRKSDSLSVEYEGRDELTKGQTFTATL